MSSDTFSIPSVGFFVVRGADAKLHWRGDYSGMKVTDVIPIDGGSRCLILLDIVAGEHSTFQNILCVAHDGSVLWKAELPRSHDAFTSFQMTPSGLIANTWSGYRVLLDPATGKLLEREFVK